MGKHKFNSGRECEHCAGYADSLPKDGNEKFCDTAVRTACHFARFTPDSDFFHHKFCTVDIVQSVCSPPSLCVDASLL